MIKHSLAIAALLVINACSTIDKPSAGQALTYLDYSKAYADAMIEKGRDTYGEKHSPLFASILDRKTIKIGAQPEVDGIRSGDRYPTGSNLMMQFGLFDLLYGLSETSGEPKYAAAADEALLFFFEKTASPATSLMPWGEHLYWDFNTEEVATTRKWKMYHEMEAEWPFWEQSYRLAPEAMWNYAVGLWENQISDKQTGNFSWHSNYFEPGPEKDSSYPRYGGQLIATWGYAYGHPANAKRPDRDLMLTAIDVLMRHYKRKLDNLGYIPATGDDFGMKNGKRMQEWPDQSIELSRGLWKASLYVPQDLAQALQELSHRIDQRFRETPDELKATPYELKADADIWKISYGSHGLAADMNLQFWARYQQLKAYDHPDSQFFYDYITRVLSYFMAAEPDVSATLKPLGHAKVIELCLKMYETTKDKAYLQYANKIGMQAVILFFDKTSPLPKVTNLQAHYEDKTGGPELLNAFLLLHQKGVKPIW